MRKIVILLDWRIKLRLNRIKSKLKFIELRLKRLNIPQATKPALSEIIKRGNKLIQDCWDVVSSEDITRNQKADLVIDIGFIEEALIALFRNLNPETMKVDENTKVQLRILMEEKEIMFKQIEPLKVLTNQVIVKEAVA